MDPFIQAIALANRSARHSGPEKTINVCGRIGGIVTITQIRKIRNSFINPKASAVPTFSALSPDLPQHFCRDAAKVSTRFSTQNLERRDPDERDL
jgi:hypothetical protein